MKISNFETLKNKLTESNRVRIVIASASEEEILLANEANALADFILLGDESKMLKVMKERGIDSSKFQLIHMENHHKTAKQAIQLIHEGKADIPMKGALHTSTFMSAVLNKETGLERTRRLSQITIFEHAEQLRFLTDCAINIETDLKTKHDIILNGVSLARAFGIDTPKVALLGAVETVNEKMEDTMISAALTQMNRRGQIANCLVDGPLSLDNAISKEAAVQKGIVSDVAGLADILVGSCLQEANSLSKSLNFYANISTASVIVGTKQPIIMTSRTDKKENKINSIAATCYYQAEQIGRNADV